MMKRIITVCLILFLVIYMSIVLVGLGKKPSTGSNVTIPSVTSTTSGPVVLDATEVSKHSSQASCYMIINNKVYDISSYFGSHPGGNSYLAAYCGKEATTAFDVSPHAHSNYANSLLAKYLLGNLGVTINSGSAPATTGNGVTSPPTSTGENDD